MGWLLHTYIIKGIKNKVCVCVGEKIEVAESSGEVDRVRGTAQGIRYERATHV